MPFDPLWGVAGGRRIGRAGIGVFLLLYWSDDLATFGTVHGVFCISMDGV